MHLSSPVCCFFSVSHFLCISGCSLGQELTVSISVIPDGDILEGSEVTLSCNCEGDPPAIHIIWYKGSTDTYLGRTFTLNNISRADSGEYRCQCYNTFEDISKSVTLNVQCKVKFRLTGA